MPNIDVFISHAFHDYSFVQQLRAKLELYDLKAWMDSRELAPGDFLLPEIEKAIQEAGAVFIVVTNATFKSRWVKKELDFAKSLDKRIVALLLDGHALDWMFDEEPLAVPVSTEPGGLTDAMPRLLDALGRRRPDGPEPAAQPPESPVNELLLALEKPAMYTEGGVRRGMAQAKLEFHPAGGGDAMESASFEFISPLGPIEADRLKWYIEEFPRYPFLERILERAAEVEKQIPGWGKSLLDVLTTQADTRDVLKAWINSSGERRFSVKMDVAALRIGADNNSPDPDRLAALEASGILLSTPWEILHDGKRFLFQGQNPIRVRRRLPFREQRDAMPLHEVLRILLVAPRPDDKLAGYIDHRLATRALLEATDALGERAELHILETPTFAGLCEKIRAATTIGKPFSVVHFDGHGVFDRNKGLGALCFESGEAEEQKKFEGRATHIVDASELAAELDKLRIPLFFLDACQSAMTDHDPTASVAATLLENGVASVAAMSHSVLVATAGRFAAAFYKRLAEGALVGSAMLAGQRALHDDKVRANLPGGEKLRLDDWFVPVLFQEKKDPQLVRAIPGRAALELDQKAWQKRLGHTPPEPAHGFVGRDRELLRLERQLRLHPWAVLRGQGGAGKTTLATEFARWMLRTRRFGRLAFVSFEFLNDVRAAIDLLGKQLINKDFSVATYTNDEAALLDLDRALRDAPTLIVLDNLESILPDAEGRQPPGVQAADEIMAFFSRLLQSSDRTRLLLTTRERMPAPFDRGDCETRLGALTPDDALALIAHLMRKEGIAVPSLNSEDLDAQFGALARHANYHARALTLLTRALAERHANLPGLNADYSRLMAEMEQKHPGNRENSLFASLELSLRRLPEGMREVVDALAVYHGGADVATWAMVAEREQEEIGQVGMALIQAGLAELVFDKFPYYFRLDPALPAYLAEKADPVVLEACHERWMGGMLELTGFLYKQRFQDAQLAQNLALLIEQNLLALLARLATQAEPELVVEVAQSIEELFANLGRSQVLAFAQEIREKAATRLGEWGHAQFTSKSAAVDRLLERGNLQAAFQLAQQVLKHCQSAGIDAYPGAAYDTALAHFRLARVLNEGGQPQQALPLFQEARKQFLAIEMAGGQGGSMVSTCQTEIGNCFQALGQYEESAKQYEAAIALAEKRGDYRSVAIGNVQLATTRMYQKRYPEALALYEAAKNTFEKLGEPGTVAIAWHQIGMVQQRAGNYAAAEHAYQESLAIRIRQKNRAGEATSLIQLGNLYGEMGRLEDAVRMYEQAVELHRILGDLRYEGVTCGNLAFTLIKLHRYPEARDQLFRAIECDSHFGHVAESWKTWAILYDLETAEGNAADANNARSKAMAAYAAYRRDGGESQSDRYQLIVMVVQAIQAGKEGELLPKFEAALAEDRPLFEKALLRQLFALLRGSRDAALADDPELDYMDAVELQLLLAGGCGRVKACQKW